MTTDNFGSGINEEMDRIMAEILETTAVENCPSLDDLTDLADGTITSARYAEVRRHLQECPACASLALQIKKEFAPLRDLHDGWMGWKGAILARQGKLNGRDMPANSWREHVSRCPRCRFRVQMLAGQTTAQASSASYARPRRRFAAPALSFAAGAAMMLIFVSLHSAVSPDHKNEVSSVFNPGTPETFPKNNPPVTVTTPAVNPWLSSKEALARFVHPGDPLIHDVVGTWEQVATDSPTATAPLAALNDLYGRLAAQAKNPKERQQWEEKQLKVKTQLVRILMGTGAGQGQNAPAIRQDTPAARNVKP